MTNAKKLDLVNVLTGIDYPKDTVEVFLNPGIAYRLSQIEEKVLDTDAGTPEMAALEAEKAELEDLGRAASLTFHLTGIPRHVRESILEEVLEEHPNKTDMVGRIQPNPDGDAMYTNRIWATQIEKIVGADGSELEPTVDDIIAFRAQAPDEAIHRIVRALAKLAEGEKSGFEALAKKHDFLSQP